MNYITRRKHRSVCFNGIKTVAAPNDKEISLQYHVDRFASPSENVKFPKVTFSDNGWSEWIASRDSIRFAVPLDYLKEDLQIYVDFNYEWEISPKGGTMNDPEHRVSFRGIDLPEKPLACKE